MTPHGGLQDFHQLMRHRIMDILLVASPYDSFVLEEAGQIGERVVGEFRNLDLHYGPGLTTVATGGEAVAELGGFFVRPTVLTGVKPGMTVACEEVFGPVLAVIPFDTEDEALALANDSRYGLAGAVWTKDIHRGHRVAHKLQAGTVWINAYRVVGPDVPFGGMGLSGIGRENGIDTVREYTQTKAVWVELTGGTRDPFTLG